MTHSSPGSAHEDPDFIESEEVQTDFERGRVDGIQHMQSLCDDAVQRSLADELEIEALKARVEDLRRRLTRTPAQQASDFALRLRRAADHDGPQELKMVMRRIATELERQGCKLTCDSDVPCSFGALAKIEILEAMLAAAAPPQPTLCEDCPPVGYPTDKTRCIPCPRRAPPQPTPEMDNEVAADRLYFHADTAAEIADAIAEKNAEITRLRAELLHQQGIMAGWLIEKDAEIERMRTVLEAYEQWEADIILENQCWTGRNVRMTDAIYERMIELQAMRNAALKRAGYTPLPPAQCTPVEKTGEGQS